jgi:hypothetical protein
MKNPTVRTFAPEQWGQLEKFSKFYTATFAISEIGKRSVSGAVNHFHKAITLKSLAAKLSLNLEIDRQEIENKGYTKAINSGELSAVIESVVTELYSSLDCTRKLLSEIYKKYRGVPDSTRKFFQNACAGKFDPNFPEYLLEVLKEASWYPELREFRDELTHSDIGSCHLDKKTKKIFYMHTGLGQNGKSLVIDDIFTKLEEFVGNVNSFTGKVFWFLNQQLKDEEVFQMCGIFYGRIYSRYVSPRNAVDFNSGRCDVYRWFEKEENPTCPFVSTCGAYKNANKGS